MELYKDQLQFDQTILGSKVGPSYIVFSGVNDNYSVILDSGKYTLNSFSGEHRNESISITTTSMFRLVENGTVTSFFSALTTETLFIKNGDYKVTVRFDGTFINFKSYYNETLLTTNTASAGGFSNVILIFAKDSENHFGAGILQVQNNGYSNLFKAQVFSDVLNVKSVIPVVYNWKSIKGLLIADIADLGFTPPSNLNNVSNSDNMLISYIPDESLNDGEQVINGEDFVIKPPSIDGWISEYNDQSFTNRTLFLKNQNYVQMGKKSVGLGGNQYKFTFFSKFTGNPLIPQIIYYDTTVSTSLGDGTPYLGFIIDEDNEAVKLNVIFVRTLVDQSTGIQRNVADFNTITMSDSDMHQLFIWFRESYNFIEDNTENAENPDQGGDETDPVDGDILNRLELPRLGAVGSGFVSLYEVNDTQMQALSAFMWDDSLITNLGRLFEDPREIIVGIMVFPVKPDNVTSNTEIKAGNLNTGIFANYLTKSHMRRYCGKRRIPKGNSDFMSFAPYRRLHLVLPYCEDLELDPSAVYGAVLKLYYHIDFFSGNCVVEITKTFDDGEEQPFMYSKGQIGYQIPISSVDYTRAYTELLKFAFRISNGDPINPKVNYNGGGGASFGALGSQQPYIVIEDAIPAYDGSQPQYIGNTYYKVRRLGDCDGFTKCFEAHIEGVHAIESELNEIMDWLTNGVIIHPSGGSSTPSIVPSTPGNTVINFMKLSSEVNVIGKTWTNVTPIEGKLIFDQSISEPKILVNSSALEFNYCYMGLFNRFYFVKDVIARNTDLIEIQLKSDPLESFKDEILNSYASIDRQSQNGNKFIKDPYMWVQENKNVKILTFKDGGISFDWGHTEDCYILTIAGA